MTKLMTSTVAVAALTLLAACGGSGGSVPNLSFSEYGDLAEDISDRIEDLDGTPFESLPSNGVTTYDGVMAAEVTTGSSELILAGAAEIDVDFGANTLTGQVTNIRNRNNRAFDGNLRIRDGAVFSFFGEALSTAKMRGTLTRPDGREIQFRGNYVGTFGGPGGQAHVAGVEGTVVNDGRNGTFEAGIIAD